MRGSICDTSIAEEFQRIAFGSLSRMKLYANRKNSFMEARVSKDQRSFNMINNLLKLTSKGKLSWNEPLVRWLTFSSRTGTCNLPQYQPKDRSPNRQHAPRYHQADMFYDVENQVTIWSHTHPGFQEP